MRIFFVCVHEQRILSTRAKRCHVFWFGFQVCLNYECKSADELKYDCDVQNKCHAHGVGVLYYT